jgi:hypothetical protein
LVITIDVYCNCYSKTRELSVALAHRQEAALESEQELQLIHDSATQAGTRGQAILKNAVERMHMRSIENHAKAALAANDMQVMLILLFVFQTLQLQLLLCNFTHLITSRFCRHTLMLHAYGGSFNHSALLQQSESGSSMGAVHDCASEADATTVDNLMMLRQLHADGELDLQQAAIKALPKCLTSTLAMQVILVVLLMGCTYD